MFVDKNKMDLIQKIMGYDDEYLENELLPKSLFKMQKFLVSQGYADTFRNIKNMPRIEIKGLASNGKERLLVKELREAYDSNILEESTRFNTLYPLIDEGVIKYKSARDENRYTHFKVISQTEKTFSLEMTEYKYCHNTFYLCFNIVINELSKHNPFYMSKVVGKDVRTIFFDTINNSKTEEFEEIEKSLIKNQIGMEQNVEEEFSLILSNTIAHIRATNFLWDVYHKKILSNIGDISTQETFFDNKYFQVKNWDYNSDLNDLDKKYNIELEDYIDDLLTIENTPLILRKSSVQSVLNRITQKKNIIQFQAAVGYAFKSGLVMIEDIFNKIHEKNGECNLIVGALQNYNGTKEINKIDKPTAQYLNVLMKNTELQLYTYDTCFYHGKFYYLANDDYAFVIMGSTNISNPAFKSNYELDTLYILKKGSVQERQFLNWYHELKDKCKLIPWLNEKLFDNYRLDSELDAFKLRDKHLISIETARKQIYELSDEETQFRLNLWMSHLPTAIYEDVDVAALSTYKMFVFVERELVVFESFESQNAFYAFGCPNGVEDLINSIELMTKMQMTLSQYYIERGNHSSNKKALQKRIERFFA